MTLLSLTLLGQFQITRAGRPVQGFRSARAQALLVYLAVESGPQRRESLMALFWPDAPETAARANLRTTLFNLRQALGDPTAPVPLLRVTATTLQLDPAAGVRCDVTAFRTALAATERHAHPARAGCRTCRDTLAAIPSPRYPRRGRRRVWWRVPGRV